MENNDFPFPPQHYLDEMHQQEKAAKARIVKDWLPRYTGMPLEKFGEYILLVNFGGYVKTFADQNGVPV
ncbi:MAG TPA: hypothetical protein PK228_10545, partial [Saprospiraceae bacterium]|nr:hypothetical protein [Saprospiraceae bacterium]